MIESQAPLYKTLTYLTLRFEFEFRFGQSTKQVLAKNFQLVVCLLKEKLFHTLFSKPPFLTLQAKGMVCLLKIYGWHSLWYHAQCTLDKPIDFILINKFYFNFENWKPLTDKDRIELHPPGERAHRTLWIEERYHPTLRPISQVFGTLINVCLKFILDISVKKNEWQYRRKWLSPLQTWT